MTSEEKAKAYDEAIKRGLDYIRQTPATEMVTRQDVFEAIFPEYAESDDEKIRKEMIRYFTEMKKGGSVALPYDDCIAYLEKQKDLDKMIVVSPEVWDKAISDAFENGEKDGEKQKEQKVSVDDFKAKDWYVSKVDGKIHNIYYSVDKVKPKFKVGDKIIEKDFDECGRGTIIDIKDGKYIFDDGGFICIEEQGLWKLVEQKPAEKQDYSDLNDLEKAIHRGFLAADVENVPVTIIKETAKDCLAQINLAGWSEEDKKRISEIEFAVMQMKTERQDTRDKCLAWLKSLRPPLKDREMKLKILKYLSTRCSSLEYEEVEDYLNNLRPSWKPTEEQMKAIRLARSFVMDDFDEHPTLSEILMELEEQLKKLM